jgi:hypothetical protein
MQQSGHALQRDTDSYAYGPAPGLLPDPFAATDQAPSVTTTISVIEHLGLDGLITGNFRAYSPQPLTGTLVLAVGSSAASVPSVAPSAAPLNHVIAQSPVTAPTVLADLAFRTPAAGADKGLAFDIGIAATTPGFSGLIGPLTPALAGTTLGNELTPLVKLAALLLPGLGKNGGEPHGGSLDATPFFTADAGLGASTTTTVLGVTTKTNAEGTLAFTKADSQGIVNVLQDGATLLSDGAILLSDVQSGNITGAVATGVNTLATAAILSGSVVSLLQSTSHSGGTLAAVAHPALSLNLSASDSQSYALGVGTPLGVSEDLTVHITADALGAYTLGKLAAAILPQVIADYGNGGVPNASSIFAQLAEGVSALSQNLLSGSQPGAGPVPSSGNAADVSITATLVTGESEAILGGKASGAQTFSLGLDTNAQGLYDLGTASQPVLTDLLVGLLETPQGQEALQVGGAILQSLDGKISGSGAIASPAYHPADGLNFYAHPGMFLA